MISYNSSKVNWFRLFIILVYATSFLLFSFPLASFPSSTFTVIWGVVLIAGACDFVIKIRNGELRLRVRAILVGLLFGAALVNYNWVDINPTISELGVALSPLLIFGDVFMLNKSI